MKFRQFQIFILLMFFTGSIVADNYNVRISGYIIDATTNQIIPDQIVTIKIKNPASQYFYFDRLFTDEQGFYSRGVELPYSFGVVEISTVDCNNSIISRPFFFSPMQTDIVSNFFICFDPALGYCKSDFMFISNPEIANQVIFKQTSFGEIDHYFWSFGDGTTSEMSNPIHIYQDEGEYEVCLKISNEAGDCVDVLCQTVNVYDLVDCVANFFSIAVPSFPGMIGFYDTSEPEMTSWLWDFGDGNTSTDQNPVHTYTQSGNYMVCLTAENSISGCADSYCEEVIVASTDFCEADFGFYFEPEFPSTIYFIDNSKGEPESWQWDFGDGNTSTEQNPEHSYSYQGTFEVCLTIFNTQTGCEDTKCDLVVVDNQPGCNAYFNYFELGVDPHTYRFIDMSIGNVEIWEWDFGDGTTSTLQNPVHAYYEPGIFNVCLNISDEAGYCSDVFCEMFYVDILSDCVAKFDYLIDTGNVSEVSFINESIGSATQWEWDFGDGTFSTDQSPVHIFNEEGLYLVCLNIDDNTGNCQDVLCKYVLVSSEYHCKAGFDHFMQPENPRSIQFVDLSTGNSDLWIWEFGDGMQSVAQNPLHEFADDGEYQVCLIATDLNGNCTDTYCELIQVSVEPDCDAAFTSFISQDNPFLVQFIDESVGDIASWHWDFGDGETSVVQNPWHTFLDEGNYNVCLIVTNSSGICTSTLCKEVLIQAPDLCHADFDFEISGEEMLSVQFMDQSQGSATQWLWDFGDGNFSALRNPVHIFADSGNYQVKLKISQPDPLAFCSDSVVKNIPVSVAMPSCYADFEAYPDSGLNTPYLFHFKDLSVNNPDVWLWDFGDGNSSSDRNPVHQYNQPGIFDVTLIITKINPYGEDCVDTKTLQVQTPEYFHIGGFVYAGMVPINNPAPTGDTAIVYLYRYLNNEHIVSIDTSLFVENGYFYALYLLEGNYMLKTRLTDGSTNANAFFPMYFGDKVRWQNADILTLSDYSLYHLDVHLAQVSQAESGVGQIMGSVIHQYENGDHLPARGTEILLFNSSNEAVDYTHSANDGNFLFTGLSAGTYTLLAESTGLFTEPEVVTISGANPSVFGVQLNLFDSDITSVDEDFDSTIGDIRIFPNPVNELLNIVNLSGDCQTIVLNILNYSGQSVISGEFNQKQGDGKIGIDVSTLQHGIYFLQIFSCDGEISETFKFVK